MRVNDTLWPEEQFTTTGSVTAFFDSIPSGATVQHSYSVTPKEAGPYNAQPVTVAYNPIAGDAKEQVCVLLKDRAPQSLFQFCQNARSVLGFWGPGPLPDGWASATQMHANFAGKSTV